jgi:hypothetical protein
MELSRRGFFTAGAASVAVPTIAAAQDASAPKTGELSTATLGAMLQAMGLRPKKVDQRYDFAFRSVHDKAEWDLSMTAVLSSDSQSIWIMAWLDELPKSATDVPRTALLRLLAANDRLGNGKFFAYVASNRRFVMQRVVPNSDISTSQFAGLLKDLGTSVVDFYPEWSTANWSPDTAKSNAGTVRQTSAESQ